MQRKQVLKVGGALSEEIVAMKESGTVFVDDLFFSKAFGEDKKNTSYKSYPVQIVSFRIDWVLNT